MFRIATGFIALLFIVTAKKSMTTCAGINTFEPYFKICRFNLDLLIFKFLPYKPGLENLRNIIIQN